MGRVFELSIDKTTCMLVPWVIKNDTFCWTTRILICKLWLNNPPNENRQIWGSWGWFHITIATWPREVRSWSDWSRCSISMISTDWSYLKKNTHYIIIIPSIHIPFSYRFLPCQNPPCFLGDLRPQFKSCVKPQLVPWLFFFRIGLPSVLGIAQDCSELHPPSVFGHEIGM